MASYAETKAAIAQGLTGFTHLFNAMRPIAARHPGPIVAALETPGVWYGMIADGVHVDFAVLKLALRSVARPMLVSDAMPPVGGSRSSFTLQGRKITLRDGRCTGQDGTLAGAALDMATAVRNCVEFLDMPLTAALRAASAEPADFLGIADRLGRLKPGCRADMVGLDPGTVEVLATWVAGQSSDQG
jgi:N-acetylglucosamine-6-phosphate deacetylase